jgi:tryptophan synthase beta chain
MRNNIPTEWFNLIHQLPVPLPEDKEPDENSKRIPLMEKIRIKEMLKQDRHPDSWIPIPGKILEKYEEIGRPTPLMRAYELEEYLGTPAKIFLKREDTLPTHSFKLNSAIAQAYYAKQEGAKCLVSETGAGQWALALAYACKMYDLQVKIFWVRVSEQQKRLRAIYTQLLGGEVISSPSRLTATGRMVLGQNPDSPGSLGISIGEAIDYVKENDKCCYVSGSNIPHVLLHQTVIGLETKLQLSELGEKPDILVACCGGGSNLGGFIGPFLPEKRLRGDKLRLVVAESLAAPRLTQGEYRYDHADPAGLTPMTLSYTMGHEFVPSPVHVGGLRQHNGSAVVGVLQHEGWLESYAYDQKETFNAGKLFLDIYKCVAAPETCHALKAVIDRALEAKKNNTKPTIVGCFTGNGLLDLSGYEKIIQNKGG